MNVEDLKDKFREQFQATFAKIQESSVYNDLSEKFENLNPSQQKGVMAGVLALSLLILVAIPYTLLSSSSDSVAEFESKRTMIRELFRTKREASILDNSVAAMNGSDLQSRAQSQINTQNLQADQIRGVTDFDNSGSSASPIIPKAVIQKGVSVSLTKLTLKQVVDIGHMLQTVHQSAKMVSMEMTAQRENPHYFDVVYKIVSFALPAEPTPKDKKGKKPSIKAAKPDSKE